MAIQLVLPLSIRLNILLISFTHQRFERTTHFCTRRQGGFNQLYGTNDGARLYIRGNFGLSIYRCAHFPSFGGKIKINKKTFSKNVVALWHIALRVEIFRIHDQKNTMYTYNSNRRSLKTIFSCSNGSTFIQYTNIVRKK